VQHVYDAKHADETHAEPENERHGKGELGKKDDGIEEPWMSLTGGPLSTSNCRQRMTICPNG
jgi:hypothetical protein